MEIFERLESKVRGYIRSFPAVFDVAEGPFLFGEDGRRYIDFFAGAGTLNYGHNNPVLTDAMIAYLQRKGIVHGLDMATVAKRDFLTTLDELILKPRNLKYKVQFTGPTGTNAVETALKLARRVKKRSNVIAFTNGYHGLTMGSLAVTGNDFYRDEHYGARDNADNLPFDGYFGPDTDTVTYLRKFISDKSSGVDLPAAIILETVQGEGGINVASDRWLRELEALCREYDILMIVDDIQMGNGRTGPFFSFERAGIVPDMVTVSKSIGGGLPMALLLMRPDLDQWKPGEHTGTFRGNNLAFVAATAAIKTYWSDDKLTNEVRRKGAIMQQRLQAIVAKYPALKIDLRGVGMVWGLDCKSIEGFAEAVSRKAFEKGLVIELAGSEDHVVKFLPSLIMEESVLREGIAIIESAIGEVADAYAAKSAQPNNGASES